MPYLRLYAEYLPVEQKRVIAQELIEITLRTFRLRADQRYRTTVQFITQSRLCEVDGSRRATLGDGGFTLEVLGHNLTEEKKRAFAQEATAMLTHFLPIKLWGRIVHLLGVKVDVPRQIALRFNELSPATSDPFMLDPQHRAA